LNSIEGSSLSDLISNDPECQRIVENEILANSTDETVIAIGAVQRGGEGG
jgi:hypothetical protein